MPLRLGLPGRLALRALLIVLAFTLPVLTGCSDSSTRLPDNDSMLWYEFEHAMPPAAKCLAYYAADITGDGLDEGVSFVQGYDDMRHVTVYRIREDQTYVISQINSLALKSDDVGVLDLTGDGSPEIIKCEQTGDGWVRIIALDLGARDAGEHRKVIGTAAWDASGHVMPNGCWGGFVRAVEAFDLDGDGVKETLVLRVWDGLTAWPRAIWMLDWRSGEIIWDLPTGATPSGDAVAADVDDDGTPELVVALESPGNGASAGEWDDLHSYVAVVSLEGRVLWWRMVAGYSSKPDIAVGDFDCDGSTEIASTIGGNGENLEEWYSLKVWRGCDGDLLAEMPLDGPVNEMDLLMRTEGPRLVIGEAGGAVRSFAFTEGALVEEARFDCGEAVWALGAVDLGLAGVGPCLALRTNEGTLAALDEDLRPLAMMRTREFGDLGKSGITPCTFKIGGKATPGFATQTSEALYWLHVEKRRVPPGVARLARWLAPVAIVFAALGLVMTIGPWRRSTLGVLRARLTPAAEREQALDELLEKLKSASHGRLAVTGTFRRLERQLLMLSGFDDGAPDGFEERYREAVRDASELGVASVRLISRDAERLGVAPASVARLGRSLSSASAALRALPATPPVGPAAAAAAESVGRVAVPLDESLTAIREETREAVSVSLFEELRRAVAVRRDELEAADIELMIPGASRFERDRVLGTAPEVSFVVDNLIENAIRAVQECDSPRIDITVAEDGDRLVMRVADNGAGVPAGLRERIFEGGVSDREGGGHGLFRSRNILTRRGGSVDLAESAPGAGATFVVGFERV